MNGRTKTGAGAMPSAQSLLTGAVFDSLAARYDEVWTNSTIGRLQRDAVWQRLDGIFDSGESLLDLGCGTGEDALHFMRLGVRVRGIDASPEMVRIACGRGVNAMLLPIEDLHCLRESFDGAISNFGAVNHVSDLNEFCRQLAELIRPGGRLALCWFGRFCLWETAWNLVHGKLRSARWSSMRLASSHRIRTRRFSISQVEQAFRPRFTMTDWQGIGLTVPPSCIPTLPDSLLRFFGTVDRHLAHRRAFRALADHRLAIFIRK